MDTKITEIFLNSNACLSSRKYANGLPNIEEGWQISNQGVLMVGLIALLGMCQYQNQLDSIVVEAVGEFVDRSKYLPYSEEAEQRVSHSLGLIKDELPSECIEAIKELHKFLRKLTLVYRSTDLEQQTLGNYVSYNEKILAGIVRKHIPVMKDEEVLSYG